MADNNKLHVISGTNLLETREKRKENLEIIERRLRERAKLGKTFNEKIETATHASIIWGRSFDLRNVYVLKVLLQIILI